jgi:ABC-type multidrug transport system permease subunit
MVSLKRYLLLLAHEFRLARTTIPIHFVAIIEPVVMYALMTVILVHPTFDMYVTYPDTDIGHALVSAMYEVGSPIGEPYIHPILVDATKPTNVRQLITVEREDGVNMAVQRYNLIDDNLVKNYRNRLTASALQLWNDHLGDQAVTVVEHTNHPSDISYNVYFGMTMLSLAAFLAAAIIGGVLTAQEFEFRTMVEYKLAPTWSGLVLSARFTRLVISSLIASGLVLLLIGLINGHWPDSFGLVGVVLVLVSLIGTCFGITAGLLLRRTLPSLLVGLILSFVGWLLGDAFAPAASGPGGWYVFVSRFSIHSYAVDLLLPLFYNAESNAAIMAWIVLILSAMGMLILTFFIYRRTLSGQE